MMVRTPSNSPKLYGNAGPGQRMNIKDGWMPKSLVSRRRKEREKETKQCQVSTRRIATTGEKHGAYLDSCATSAGQNSSASTSSRSTLVLG